MPHRHKGQAGDRTARRLAKAIARYWWSVFAFYYVPNCLWNVWLVFTDQGLGGVLRLGTLAHAFFLDKLWLAWQHNPVFVTPLVHLSALLVSVGRSLTSAKA